MDIKAIYKIPEMRYVFVIFSSIDEVYSSELDIKMKFHEIIHSKYSKIPIKNQSWKIKLISQEDFLSAIPQHKSLNNQTSYANPESMELLAINISKTQSDISKKELSFVDDLDLIEVFI